jgi:hypothetical protein
MQRQADLTLPEEILSLLPVSLPRVGCARWDKVAILKIATTS